VLAQLNPVEVWTLRITPSTLYNIERVGNPVGGGGHRYIQISGSRVPSILSFLGASMPPPPIPLQVRNPYNPGSASEAIEFDRKSGSRMRITNQNRHSPSSLRPRGWSPGSGFPTLPAGHVTADARALLNQLGHVHIYLARDAQGDVWAGFTQGAPTAAEASLPFAKIAWGTHRGGHWTV
jgi:hypothetical protein